MNKLLSLLLILFSLPGCSQEIITGRAITPVIPLPISIADHRYGADVSFDSNTDLYFSDKFHGIEAAHFKHNLGFTLFDGPLSTAGAAGVLAGGRGGTGIYLYTDRWNDYDPIPDYSVTTWTATGDAAFSGASTGASKAAKNPNHGQQMFDISGGVYGYNGTGFGASNGSEIVDLIYFQRSLTPGTPLVVSLRNGAQGIVPALYAKDLTLSARNSETSASTSVLINAYASTGDLENTGTTTRFANEGSPGVWGSNDMAISATEYANMVSAFASTVTSGGFFSNFSHFHWVYDFVNQTDDYETMMSGIRAEADVNSTLVFSGGYESIVEYLWLRENVTANAYQQGDEIRITTAVTGAIPLLSEVTSPVTIKHEDAKGWAGLSCDGCVGVRKDGNVYFLDVMVNNEVVVTEDAAATYYDFTVPVVTTATLSGSTVTVATNIPTYASLFYTLTSNNIYGTPNAPLRSGLSTSHSFDVSGLSAGTLDFYVGVVSEVGQSTLITVN